MAGVGRHGDGGITRRRDGRLQVSITLTSGRRIYRTIPRLTDAKRQMELARRAQRELIEVREAELDPGGQTLTVFLRSWLDSMASLPVQRIRPNTLAGYRIIAERHLLPVLGDMRLEAIRERHVQTWLDGLRMSPQYVTHCRAFLRRVLNVAVDKRIIGHNAATRGVELPKVPRYRAAPLTEKEATALLRATSQDRLGAFWRLALFTGFREGELLGLGWKDVDLERGTVTMKTALVRLNGEWVRAETKAAREMDTIAIDGDTARALEAHRIRQAAERQADWSYWGLVFLTPSGRPFHRREITEAFREACDKAGIDRRRVHDLRHSNSTLMRALGIDREVRKARHGHSTDEMDARYSRPSESQDRAAVERLAEAIG